LVFVKVNFHSTNIFNILHKIALGIAAASSDGQKQGFARSFLPIGDIAKSPTCKEMPKC
jgi:hypothetical protein